MEHIQNNSYYQCPGRGSLVSCEVPPKVHFPEQPKIYPLDITEDSSLRQKYSSNTSYNTYLN